MATPSPWRLSVAPMMRYTDRHCRHLHRLLTRRTLLYTEMITSGALVHGDVAAHLRKGEGEHPVALQLGGSDPRELAHSARLGEQWGYDEINLNCGCPSERVQRGSFGACLMAEPALVADCVRAMVDVVQAPVTVKHRIGVDRIESYDFVRDFIGTVAEAGCSVFIVHARNAWLKGLSPRENREIPPLRYETVYRLKRDFPGLTIVLNGGVRTNAEIAQHLQHVDGVMVGRAAYHDPWMMASWDVEFLQGAYRPDGTEGVEGRMVDYMREQQEVHGIPWSDMARHMLGLHRGRPGVRHWRQVWSDHHLKQVPVSEVAIRARQVLQSAPTLAAQGILALTDK